MLWKKYNPNLKQLAQLYAEYFFLFFCESTNTFTTFTLCLRVFAAGSANIIHYITQTLPIVYLFQQQCTAACDH